MGSNQALFRQQLIAGFNSHGGVLDGVGDVEAYRELAAFAREVHGSVEIRAREAADFANRQPVLAKLDGLLRLEESVGLLVAEEPGLDLDVGALVVGERPAPVLALGVPAPGPDLLAGHSSGEKCTIPDPVRGW